MYFHYEYKFTSKMALLQIKLLCQMKQFEYFVEFEVLPLMVMRNFIIWNIMVCSPVKASWQLEEDIASIIRAEKLARKETRMKHAGMRGLVHSSSLKIDSSKTFIDSYWTTRWYILEGRHLIFYTVPAWLLFAVGCTSIVGILECIAVSIFKEEQNRDSMDFQQY